MTRLDPVLVLFLAGIASSATAQSAPVQPPTVRTTPAIQMDGMVNTETGGMNFLGSVQVGKGLFLFGGSGYRLKSQQVGTSYDVGFGSDTPHGRRLSTYVRVGARGQRELNESNSSIGWHLRPVTEIGGRLCAGRLCATLGLPAVWVKPIVMDVAAGISVGLR